MTYGETDRCDLSVFSKRMCFFFVCLLLFFFQKLSRLFQNACAITNSCEFPMHVQVINGYKYKDLEQIYTICRNTY